MEIFYLLGAVQSFFLATLFFSRGGLSRPQHVLILFFVLNGLILLDHYLELTQVVFTYPHLLGIVYPIPLALGPVLLFYTVVLTSDETVPIRRFFLFHSGPFLIVTTYLLLAYYFLPAASKIEFYNVQTTGDTSPFIYLSEALLFLTIPTYSLWSLAKLVSHEKKIKARFSFRRNVDLKWWKLILCWFFALSIISLFTNLLSDAFTVIHYQLGDNIVLGGAGHRYFFHWIFRYQAKCHFYRDSSSPPADATKKLGSSETSRYTDEDLSQLMDAMKVDKLYLNGSLTLRDLAEYLQMTENNFIRADQ